IRFARFRVDPRRKTFPARHADACAPANATMTTSGLLCYCRQGFEPELAAELTERAAEAGFAGYARTGRDSGLVAFMCDEADALSRALPFSTLVFARQKLRLLAELRELD